MGRLLIILFIVIPALEIWTIISVGQWIGGWQTFALMIITGFAGAYLSKKEAGKVWAYAQQQMSMGQPPGHAIMEGICIFTGGLLLMSPGFLTDVVGILLLLPITRPIFRRLLYAWIQKKLSRGQTFFFFRR